MTCLEWSRKLGELREGRLRLQAPEENGLSREAGRSFFDLQEYVKALEHGYRRVCEDLDLYRKRERVRGGLRFEGKTVEELLENQRSVEACLGYALMALQQERHNDIWPVLDRMRMEMEAKVWMPWDAEQAYRRYAIEAASELDGGTGEGRTPHPSPAATPSPQGEGFGREGGTGTSFASPSPTGADGEPEWVGPSAELKTEVQG